MNRVLVGYDKATEHEALIYLLDCSVNDLKEIFEEQGHDPMFRYCYPVKDGIADKVKKFIIDTQFEYNFDRFDYFVETIER